MVTARSLARVRGLVMALFALLALSACADFWKLQTLQEGPVDEGGRDATLTTALSEAGGDGNLVAETSPEVSTCAATSLCGGECRALMTDLENCGACGKRCLTSQICQGGACACIGNEALCGAGAAQACVDTMTDHANCGDCGNVCPATTACQMGTCVCPGAEKLCTGTCVYTNSDHNNCGGCGNVCPVGGSCQTAGSTGTPACACPTGQQTCGAGASASCVDTTTDHNNCGGCGTVCPTSQTCSNSKCVPCASIGPTGIMCGTPLTCVNTATDHSNCGGCGEPCPPTEICQGGTCVCPGGETLCGSGAAEGCVTLTSDQNNCGKCGTQCSGGMICTNSACVCPGGYHNCGGTCVPNNSTSTSSCGTTCGVCPVPVQGAASCAGTPPACGQSCAGTPTLPTLCNPGANAACVNTTDDVANCGGCGQACSTNHTAQISCGTSKCSIATCATGYADCDKNPANGCEIDTNTNVGNCGGCGVPCNMTGGVEGCVGGKCTQPICNAPNANCDGLAANGCEVDTATDKNNCGTCGHICPTGTSCAGGVCSKCGPMTLLCGSVNGVGGTCAPCTTAAPTNGTLTCSASNACQATCPNAALPNLCGTACVNTNTDSGNCGMCGSPCSLATQSNKCEQAYACQGGVCTGSNPVTCPPAADSCHAAGTCAPSTGACSPPTALTGTPCTGSNECDSYMCQAGVCTGTNDVTCTASNSCNTPGTCQPGTGTCTAQTPVTGGACTVTSPNMCDTYSCVSGTCTGTSAVVCAASDGCHTVGVCNPSTGMCSNPAAPDGTPCAGSNLCLTYACMTGICTATGATGTCTPIDQCHSAMCSGTTGTCVDTALPNGTTCNDGNACTQTDTCQAGVCTGSNPVTCAASDSCHVAGVCSPSTGMCSNPSASDGTTCSGTNACESYACLSGVCTGSDACTAQDQCHVAGMCVSGSCTNPTITDGTPCSGTASGMMCESGDCVCPPSDPTMCSAPAGGLACTNTMSDVDNCGMCGNTCGMTEAGGSPSCSGGACAE